MAKSGKSADKIQDLLSEKQRIEQWLDRLDSAETSSAVRSRVAQDYRDRLDTVVTNLQGYREDLATALGEQQQRRTSLESDEETASERLAEAELRHAVGEYDEATWSKLRTDIVEELVGVRENLKSVRSEIDMLDGVIRLIDAPAAVADQTEEEPEAEAPTPRKAPTPARSAKRAESAAAVEERKSVEVPELPQAPETAPTEKDRQSDGFDELAFLKSVTDSQEQSAGDDGGGTKPKKTLVCAECGANNLPTEWYCERCGAELAAL